MPWQHFGIKDVLFNLNYETVLVQTLYIPLTTKLVLFFRYIDFPFTIQHKKNNSFTHKQCVIEIDDVKYIFRNTTQFI